MGRTQIILARLASDPDERIVKCFARKCAPFFIQFPQVRPKITDNDINALVDEGLIDVDYAPCVQRGGGLVDDIASYFFDKGEVVYGLTEKGLNAASKKIIPRTTRGSLELAFSA